MVSIFFLFFLLIYLILIKLPILYFNRQEITTPLQSEEFYLHYKVKYIMINNSDTIKFSKWRRRIWPFNRCDLNKLLPLILIKFFISINYGIFACMKDTIVVTSKNSGAEVISVLKGWVVLPVAIIVAIIYSKLSNILSKKTLFYTIICGFLLVVFICGFILYPNIDTLSPNDSADWLVSKFGTKSEHWVAVYRNWIQTILFVTAELWGSVVILVMFWGFANDVTTIDEAKKSYNIYIAAGDLAAFCVGPIVYFFTKKLSKFEFIYTLQSLIGVSIIIGFCVMIVYWFANKYLLTEKNFLNPNEYTQSPRKNKEKLSLRQGFSHLMKSRYLLGIAILVVGYGLTINLIEVTWKASVKLIYSSPAEYQMFIGKTTSCVGFFAFITSIFLGGNIIRRFGWHVSAQLTPIIVGITGVCFFTLILCKNSFENFTQSFGCSPLLFIVIFGAFQNVISKVIKYSFFDPTKEMAYIPLDKEAKVKGKAAIDVVGSRLGKSGASFIQIALIDLIGTGSIFSVTHILLPIIVVVTFSWILSVRSLSKKFAEKHIEHKLFLQKSN